MTAKQQFKESSIIIHHHSSSTKQAGTKSWTSLRRCSFPLHSANEDSSFLLVNECFTSVHWHWSWFVQLHFGIAALSVHHSCSDVYQFPFVDERKGIFPFFEFVSCQFLILCSCCPVRSFLSFSLSRLLFAVSLFGFRSCLCALLGPACIVCWGLTAK